MLGAAGEATLVVVARIRGWTTSVLCRSGMVNVTLNAAACIVLGGCAVAVLCVGARRVAALLRAYRAADAAGDMELVVTGGRPMAHASPARRGHIVVSRQMLALLDGHERRAPTRCCRRCARRSRMPWSAGPMSPPPSRWVRGTWWHGRSARPHSGSERRRSER
ncbi:MAG: hypothetical protein ACRDRN_05450 [Sciscionella sp.]